MKLQVFVILVVGLFLGASFSSAQVRNEPCKCADKDLLLDALNMSQAAIQELNFQLEYAKGWEAAHGKTVYGDEFYKALEKNLGVVKNQFGSGDEFGGYQIKSSDCSIMEKSGQNRCAREIEKSLIDVYKEACREKKDLPIYQKLGEMRQVLLLQISAYQAMQKFVLDTLRSLPKTCRPNNWFGYVTYQKVQTVNSVETNAKINLTATRNSKVTYLGTLLVEEGKAASASASATDSWDLNQISGYTDNTCKGKQVARVMTYNTKSFSEGETIGNATFTLKIDFHPAIKTYDLYVDFFPINIAGQNNTSNSLSAADCAEKGYDKSDSFSFTKRVQKEGHSVTGEKIDPDSPNFLEGRRVVKPEALNQSGVKEGNTTTTKTHEIQFRWALWRLPAK